MTYLTCERSALLFVLAASLVACSGDESTDPGGTGGTTTATTTSTTTTTTTTSTTTTTTTTGSGGGGQGGSGGAGQGGAGQGGAGQGGAGGTGQGGTGQGGGGQGVVTPALESMQFFVDCMPNVPPDPINGMFSASYENNDAVAGSATMPGGAAKLVITQNAQKYEWTFVVTPTGSGLLPGGAAALVQHTKVADSGSGNAAPCSLCGGEWTLEVTWDTASGPVIDTLGPEAVQCVF